MDFIGREKELDALNRAWDTNRSAFIPVYGRRRVGKTTLVLEFLRDRPALYYAGRLLPRALQLKSFMENTAEALGDSLIAEVQPDSWEKALRIVSDRRPRGRKFALVLDEFQWIADGNPECLSALQQLWDREWEKSGDIVLVLLGSYLGFMENKVLGRKSPLFGRRTGSIFLKPFRFHEARKMLPGASLVSSARIYFVCGGIPQYLRAFDSQRSVQQGISDAFFEPGILGDEPSFLLREELRELPTYYGVLTALSHGTETLKNLSKVMAMTPQNLSYYLDELCNLGYVRRRYPLVGKVPNARSVRFELSDPLIRFWFRFIGETIDLAVRLGAKQVVQSRIVPQLDQYFGYQFEDLCRDTLPDLYIKEGVTTPFEVGEYWSKKVQIDIVGFREDGVTDLCEVKWGPIRSPTRVLEQLVNKVEYYPNPREATIVPRVFCRSKPSRLPKKAVLWHTLEDLWRAQCR